MTMIPGPNNEMISGSAVVPHDYQPNAASPIASFTPTTAGNWDAPPTTVQEALDELASRLRALE